MHCKKGECQTLPSVSSDTSRLIETNHLMIAASRMQLKASAGNKITYATTTPVQGNTTQGEIQKALS
jgi:hypothetical protein